MTHPAQILFSDARAPAALSPVDHYAGNETFIRKAIAKQVALNGAFDIALDLEDGASVGHETTQAKLMGEVLASADNRFNRLGVRIHDASHGHWLDDVRCVLDTAKKSPAYWMIPKVGTLAQTRNQTTARCIQNHTTTAARPHRNPRGAARRIRNCRLA